MRLRDRFFVAALVLALTAPAAIGLWLLVGPSDATGPEGLLLLPLMGKFVGKALKGAAKGVSRVVRGGGRLVRGKIGKGLGDIVGGATGLAPVALPFLLPGVGGFAGKALGSIFGKIPGGGGGILSKVGGALGQLNPFGGGAAGKVLGALSGGGGAGGGGGTLDRLLTLGQLGLAGANVAQGAKAQSKVNRLIGQAMGGIGGGGVPAGLFDDPDNPFKRRNVPQTARRAAVRSLVGAPAAA